MPAPRNRSVALTEQDIREYKARLVRLAGPATCDQLENRTIHHDLIEILDWLPAAFVDLLVVDPPYNLRKEFNSTTFSSRSTAAYVDWLESWFGKLTRILKQTASVYICSDWRSSTAVFEVAQRYLKVRNRITWEREKGRGARDNWKNCAEDIWFCTCSNAYTFDVDGVKIRRRVIAPYTDQRGMPKDWEITSNGNYRDTHPSNVWTDLSVPFWSMPENTEHPTQKPEKLLAKIILASSRPHDLIFDPFLGSGTTSVVARKLGRRFVGVEIDERYCCLAEKRLANAEQEQAIQGYEDGVFWERNATCRRPRPASGRQAESQSRLFSDGVENGP